MLFTLIYTPLPRPSPPSARRPEPRVQRARDRVGRSASHGWSAFCSISARACWRPDDSRSRFSARKSAQAGYLTDTSTGYMLSPSSSCVVRHSTVAPMESSPALRLDLPVEGMTCAACAARVERSLNKLPGVVANVNFAAESARVTLQPGASSPAAVVEAIRRTGYSVPDQVAEFTLYGMTCAACATRIEKVLNRIDGVSATVNFATETAHIRYVPGSPRRGTADRGDPQDRLRGDASASRPAARKNGAPRSGLPQGTARCSGFPPRSPCRWWRRCGRCSAGDHADMLPRWLQFALATPVQFWIGKRFYVGAWQRACAAAAPTWTCWWRSAPAWPTAFSAVVTLFGLHAARLFRGRRGGHHPGAAWASCWKRAPRQDLGGDRGTDQAPAARPPAWSATAKWWRWRSAASRSATYSSSAPARACRSTAK